MEAKLLETQCYHFLDQEQLHFGNHATHEDEACTVALVITCKSKRYQSKGLIHLGEGLSIYYHNLTMGKGGF